LGYHTKEARRKQDNRRLFEVVYSFDKARSTSEGGTSNKENEKLFMVKNS
jgi:hypothetical protein